MAKKKASRANTKAVNADLARIRQRWSEHKKAQNYVWPFGFVFEIVRTGRLPRA